ncbi:late promoter transcription accessory protein [Escherichia phage vB_EcoM_ESCO47]|nr:late promoter transcription accessory protein [Escherichia phage vB_EcoM_ESCO47]
MTLFSLSDIKPVDEAGLSEKELAVKQDKDDIAKLLDRQENGFLIESMVNQYGMTYLEATTAFLEENSIPETQFAKFIPSGIIEKITSEAVDENMLRPSIARGEKTNTLDFLL